MRYLALATDYDGTLAHDGSVDEATVKSLERFRHSGRKLLLVTGRELPDLEKAFSRLYLFDVVVAENGALLYFPASHEKSLIASAPPPAFIEDLRRRGITDISVGEAIVATWHPHEGAVLDSIRDLGLDLQVIFNKEAVMVLPAGVNKMTGLSKALEYLKLSRHNVVAIGDAENDGVFLRCCECSVAVENAIPSLKEAVDWITPSARGAGVSELIDRIVGDDLESLSSRLSRHRILLGRSGAEEVWLPASGKNVLLCGKSGSGKSTLVAGFIERLLEHGYQTCVLDPEGDYESLGGFVTVGDENHGPSCEQVLQLLDRPEANLVINLIGVKMQDRPYFFAGLLTKLQEKAIREGRPHWLVIDEAHHLLPSEWAPASADVADQSANLMLVTVHPEHVSPAALKTVETVITVGTQPGESIEEFAKLVETAAPEIKTQDPATGEALVWFLDSGQVFERVRTEPGKAERKRHKRKYAEGELEPERTFWFRGPEGKLSLRAQNLITFLQIAEGVDDETWLFHLHRRDYSTWLGSAIKDNDLSAQVKEIEANAELSPANSRTLIAKAVEAKYTAPA